MCSVNVCSGSLSFSIPATSLHEQGSSTLQTHMLAAALNPLLNVDVHLCMPTEESTHTTATKTGFYFLLFKTLKPYKYLCYFLFLKNVLLPHYEGVSIFIGPTVKEVLFNKHIINNLLKLLSVFWGYCMHTVCLCLNSGVFRSSLNSASCSHVAVVPVHVNLLRFPIFAI